MQQNVGTTDAAIRWALATILFVLSIVFNASPWLSLGFAVAALVMVATALTRKCPLYTATGLNTCPRQPTTRP
ncbi:MAG: DUF2892 domain-containing protein [Gemmatimonadetes bacterium]|nr:DUF2892 domain-containing protein [Gemmatimonadota bacterium]